MPLSFLIKISQAQIQDNPDDIIMTSSGLFSYSIKAPFTLQELSQGTKNLSSLDGLNLVPGWLFYPPQKSPC